MFESLLPTRIGYASGRQGVWMSALQGEQWSQLAHQLSSSPTEPRGNSLKSKATCDKKEH